MNAPNRVFIKVCGLTQAGNIREIGQLAVDFLGFNFYEKSKRFVGKHFEMPTLSNPKLKKVGIFVNECEDTILSIKDRHKLDMVQLHGDEKPEDCESLSKKGISIIKAFGLASSFDFKSLELYDKHCTYFLFDTKSIHYGGSGISFDWNLLSQYKGKTPFFLSGGLNPNSLESLLNFDHPNCIGIDLNSGFESKDGIKNFDLLNSFIEKLNKKISLLF